MPTTPDDLGPTAPCDHCGEPAGWSPSVRGFVHVATGTGTCPEASDAWPAPSGHGNAEPTTTTTTQRLTVVGPNLPREAKATFHVHAEGCADLQRGWIRRHAADAWTEEYSSLVDVEADVYDFAAGEDESYVLGDYLGEFHFAPCVHLPERIAEEDEPAPPGALVDPIVLHSRTRIREFADTLLAELGVDDAYEDDEERVFALLVQTAELYVDLLTDSGSLSIRSGIESALLGLGENLDIVFDVADIEPAGKRGPR